MAPSSFSVPIPQDVLTLAERAVNRTGLFPDTKSLMSEAVMRMRVNLESKGQDVLSEWIRDYGGHPAGTGDQIWLRMPKTVFDSFTSLSESTGENMFALAVMMHLDRLRQLRRD